MDAAPPIDDIPPEHPASVSAGVNSVEQYRQRETPLQRLIRQTGTFFVGLTRLAFLCALFTPILLAAFLTLDLPVYALDHFFTSASLKPGNWLTWGQVIMLGGAMASVLMARRFGGDEASRVIVASWGIAAVASFAELAYLAPVLAPGDIPSAQFIGAFVGSSMVAQLVAAGFYDVARGGVWWRAPFYALLAGFAVQNLFYYPVVYWTQAAPWLNWLVVDFAVKTMFAAGFLGPYWFLRKRLRPQGGFGG